MFKGQVRQKHTLKKRLRHVLVVKILPIGAAGYAPMEMPSSHVREQLLCFPSRSLLMLPGKQLRTAQGMRLGHVCERPGWSAGFGQTQHWPLWTS